MDNKNPDQKQAKALPLVKLAIVTLTEKDVFSVNGGTSHHC